MSSRGGQLRIAVAVPPATFGAYPVHGDAADEGDELLEGSRGSVLTAFREQVARGGPVTVTHPDVARRTIEAAGGDIEIEFTGLCDGEKLHEILMDHTESGQPGPHPLITHGRTDAGMRTPLLSVVPQRSA